MSSAVCSATSDTASDAGLGQSAGSLPSLSSDDSAVNGFAQSLADHFLNQTPADFHSLPNLYSTFSGDYGSSANEVFLLAGVIVNDAIANAFLDAYFASGQSDPRAYVSVFLANDRLGQLLALQLAGTSMYAPPDPSHSSDEFNKNAEDWLVSVVEYAMSSGSGAADSTGVDDSAGAGAAAQKRPYPKRTPGNDATGRRIGQFMNILFHVCKSPVVRIPLGLTPQGIVISLGLDAAGLIYDYVKKHQTAQQGANAIRDALNKGEKKKGCYLDPKAAAKSILREVLGL